MVLHLEVLLTGCWAGPMALLRWHVMRAMVIVNCVLLVRQRDTFPAIGEIPFHLLVLIGFACFCILLQESLPEALVRRHLRRLAAQRQPFHRKRFLLWISAIIPQIPILPLPLPNVTIYYTLWRISSHYSASTGRGRGFKWKLRNGLSSDVGDCH